MALAACGTKHGTALAGAGSAAAPTHGRAEEKVLNVYNWSDYIAPDILPAFKREFGIKVYYDVFDTNTVLQINAGVFRKLDKSLLPNLKYVDPDLAARMDPLDPGMEHGVIYFWGTGGVGYNVEKIKNAMPEAPVDSLRMIYDPDVVRHFNEPPGLIARFTPVPEVRPRALPRQLGVQGCFSGRRVGILAHT